MGVRQCTGWLGESLTGSKWRSLLITYRMITGGDDALYIARRLVVVASEDVGLADPQALPLVCTIKPYL